MEQHVAESDKNQLTRRHLLAGAASLAAASAVRRVAAAPGADEPQPSAEGPVIRNGRINQTICRWCYQSMPLDKLCQAAVKIGYKGIDLLSPADFPTIKKYGLVGTMTSTHPIPKGLNRKENWDECLGKIRAAIDATAEAGFPNVICFSGNRGGMDADEGMRNCATALKQVVGLAEQRKITICMELLNSKVNHPDYMCDHSSWGVPLVKMVGSERFKLLYDIYHMQIMEGDVVHTIKDHHECFGHYHTGGVPGRHEIDDTQELYYPVVCKAIVATGFKGWLGQEFLPIHNPVASLAQAARICDV